MDHPNRDIYTAAQEPWFDGFCKRIVTSRKISRRRTLSLMLGGDCWHWDFASPYQRFSADKYRAVSGRMHTSNRGRQLCRESVTRKRRNNI
jgi:hypothetical protein